MSHTPWTTVARRAVLTFVQTFLALVVLSLESFTGVVDMSALLKIGTAALAAGLSVVTSALREIDLPAHAQREPPAHQEPPNDPQPNDHTEP